MSFAFLRSALILALIGFGVPSLAQDQPPLASAVFAGGCFWCVESDFDKVEGVVSTISGYTGGQKANPTYEDVSSGTSGHVEAVQVVYDPAKITYEDLVTRFWRTIDPLNARGQFCDSGPQYRSVIYYGDEAEKTIALQSKQNLERSNRFKTALATEISPVSAFYPAENYHQDYYRKNPVKYKFYRFNCGRDKRLQEIWGNEAGH